MAPNLESNIWKFYLYRVFSCLIFATPIIVLFYQENGLSMTQIMILQSIYTLIILLGVIPSGIFADYFGRKKVLIINGIFYVAAWIVYALSHTFFQFILAEIVIALSAATWSASGTAFFYDTLKELEREKDFKKLYGNVISINYIFWGISSLFAGYIALRGMRLTFWLTALTTVISFLIVFSFHDTKIHKHKDKKYINHLKESFNFTINHKKIRLLIIFSALIFALTFVGYILYQPYFKEINIPLVYFGLLYFFLFIAAALGSKIADKTEIWLGEKKILIIIISLMVLCFLGMAQKILIFGLIFPIIISFCGGVFEPVIADYINKLVKSKQRSTIMALDTIAIELFSTISAPIIGYIADVYTLSTSIYMIAIILFIDLIILIAAIKYRKN